MSAGGSNSGDVTAAGGPGRDRRVLLPVVSALAVAAVAVAGVQAAAGVRQTGQTPGTPVVETALPTPAPSEKGCPGWGADASPAPDLPGRTASVTRLERDGSLTWTRALPVADDASGQFSPLVIGEDTLVLAGGTLRSYDTSTGREQWVVPAKGSAYGLWEADGTVVVLLDQVSPDARLVGYDPSDGDVRWSHEFPNNGLMADQVLAGRALVTVLSGGNRVQVIDIDDGTVRWTAEQGGHPLVAVVGDVVVQPGGGKLNAYRLEDGSRAWSTPIAEDEVAARAAAGVVLTVPTVQGPGYDTGVHAFDPGDGQPLWSRPGGTRQALRVAGEAPNTVLVADDDVRASTLTALDARTGGVRWTVRARTAYEQPLVTAAGVVAVPERRGESYVVSRRNLQTGEQLDEMPLPHELSLQALPGRRYLFHSYGDPFGGPGTVTVRSLSTGEQEYSAQVRHAAQPPAAGPDGSVILQGTDPARGCIG